MAVVVQPGLGVEILALEAQWVIHFGDVQLEHIAVSPVARRPAEAAIGAGQFLRGTEVVELVAGFDLFRAFAVEQGQRAEAVGFVEIGAVVPVAALGEQAFAEPEELGIAPVDLLGDASAEGVVAVGDLAPVRQADADQAVLAVVAVFGDQLLPGAAAFANEIAGRRSRNAGRPASAGDFREPPSVARRIARPGRAGCRPGRTKLSGVSPRTPSRRSSGS